MKLLKGATFSHPVVAPFLDDVRENRFELSGFRAQADGVHYHVAIEFDLHNSGLLQYIEKEMACYALLVEARNFFYRKLHRSHTKTHALKFDADVLSGYIDCIPIVIATEDIPDYRLPDFNDDYRELRIAIRSGDVLAISDGRTFVAEKECDTLAKLSSIMQVLPDLRVKPGSMEVELGTDKISIYVCQEDHAKYSTLSKLTEAAPVLMQMLAVPALQEAIVEMRRPDEASGQRRWELTLGKRLQAMSINVAESTASDIACRVLDGSLAVSLAKLDSLIAEGAD
jgi:hypothetical protein